MKLLMNEDYCPFSFLGVLAQPTTLTYLNIYKKCAVTFI